MAFTSASKETAALSVTGLGAYISLHTADPGTTGASEASGGSPAYARKATTWSGGTSDGIVTGSQVTFDAPSGTYTHMGIWTAATGGTFIAGFALSSPVTNASQAPVLIVPSVTAS